MLEAFDTDIKPLVDSATAIGVTIVVTGLRDAGYEVAPTGGAFYVFPKVPDGMRGTASEFVATGDRATSCSIIPGGISSAAETRTSASATRPAMETIDRGLDVLRRPGVMNCLRTPPSRRCSSI